MTLRVHRCRRVIKMIKWCFVPIGVEQHNRFEEINRDGFQSCCKIVSEWLSWINWFYLWRSESQHLIYRQQAFPVSINAYKYWILFTGWLTICSSLGWVTCAVTCAVTCQHTLQHTWLSNGLLENNALLADQHTFAVLHCFYHQISEPGVQQENVKDLGCGKRALYVLPELIWSEAKLFFFIGSALASNILVSQKRLLMQSLYDAK